MKQSDEIQRALLPISSFAWSVRTANCFKNSDIVTLGDLMKQTEADLLRIKNFGRTSLREVTRFLSQAGLTLRGPIPIALQSVPRMSQDNPFWTEWVSIGMEENPVKVEEFIIRDIEKHISSLQPKLKTIFCARYGFQQPAKTLEEVGNELGVTRERIRQIQVKIQNKLFRMGVVNKADLARYLKHRSGASLHAVFPKLDVFFMDKKFASRISGTKKKSIKNDNLIEFLEDYTGVDRDTYKVAEQLVAGISVDEVTDIFLEMPSPLSLSLFKQELQSLYGLPDSSLDYVITYLETNKKCRLTPKGVIPTNLSRVRGVTHVLLNFPNGCGWKTINKILANLEITKPFRGKKLRQAPDSTFSNNDHVYLYGRGIYRHIKFFDLDSSDIERALKVTASILENTPEKSVGLKEIHRDILEKAKTRTSFWDLRYALKTYGPKHGLFFDGLSGTHTLSLQKVEERITNGKIIQNLFKKQNKALRLGDIKIHLKSHISPSIINLWLNDFLESNVLVRVAPGTYCLPDVAFEKIDKVAIRDKIDEYLACYELVEHDFLRERLNFELNLSYSKYFYNSFVKYYAKKNGWHHSIDLVSAKELPFRRMSDVLKGYLKSEETFTENSQFPLKSLGVSRLTLSRYFGVGEETCSFS